MSRCARRDLVYTFVLIRIFFTWKILSDFKYFTTDRLFTPFSTDIVTNFYTPPHFSPYFGAFSHHMAIMLNRPESQSRRRRRQTTTVASFSTFICANWTDNRRESWRRREATQVRRTQWFFHQQFDHLVSHLLISRASTNRRVSHIQKPLNSRI